MSSTTWLVTEEQADYQASLRGWLADVAPSAVLRSWFDARDSATFEARFAADGWAGVGVGEELGGQGGGLLELVLTAEELARACAPSALWLATVLAIPALAGRDELLADVLGGAGAALLVPAEQVPDQVAGLSPGPGGTLTGTVRRVLAGDRAATFVAVVDDGTGRALHAVDARGPGVTAVRRDLLDRSRSVADVALGAAASTRLDVDVEAVLRAATLRAAVLVAADALGASQQMLDLSVAYSAQRTQFGRTIGSFQAVKHAAASMLVAVEAARSVVLLAATSLEDGDLEADLQAAAAKAQVTADAVRTADTALTVHGAVGFTWEHDLQLSYKRAKLDAVLHGSAGAWNDRLAAGLLSS